MRCAPGTRSLWLCLALAAGWTRPAPAAEEPSIDWAAAKEFWAFKPPEDPPLPDVGQASWPEGDIDRFVLSKIERSGARPAPEADRHTLARRVSFDLTGLPPTAAEIDAFTADRGADAFERLVDRLLASPAFGERMASLWLNVARYAEDQAHQVGDNTKFFYPHAHRYRAWVIDAFNRDLPYDQFVRLQLAADLLGEGADGDLVALGFLGLGPQYYDRKRLSVMAEEWEDSVDVVSRGFLGLTVACARCHDHKYDPISTQDYHALAGVFASTAIDKREVTLESGDTRVLHIVKDDKVRDLPVFLRGNVDDKGEEVPRRFLQVLASGEPQPFTSGSGRLELAGAIADPSNPLTARVMVNRLWQMLFGRGLVGTASNFGTLGARPSHPELLDDLALRFVREGWSVKAAVREIVLSSTYRQSSTVPSPSFESDPDNALFARAGRRRLTAEMLRDSLLAASGELVPGDSGEESQPVSSPDNRRRAVYGRVSRKELDAFLATFDYPDANVHSGRREVTVTPAQKLFLLNSPFVIARAETLALQVVGLEPELGVESLYRSVLSRSPRDDERHHALAFVRGDGVPYHDRWARLAHTLFLTNEFLIRD